MTSGTDTTATIVAESIAILRPLVPDRIAPLGDVKSKTPPCFLKRVLRLFGTRAAFSHLRCGSRRDVHSRTMCRISWVRTGPFMSTNLLEPTQLTAWFRVGFSAKRRRGLCQEAYGK